MFHIHTESFCFWNLPSKTSDAENSLNVILQSIIKLHQTLMEGTTKLILSPQSIHLCQLPCLICRSPAAISLPRLNNTFVKLTETEFCTPIYNYKKKKAFFSQFSTLPKPATYYVISAVLFLPLLPPPPKKSRKFVRIYFTLPFFFLSSYQ